MKLLLDTHTLIWFSQEDESLSQRAKSAITNPENTCFVSVVSFWEMAIKVNLGKLTLRFSLEDLRNLAVKNQIEILPVAIEHTFPIICMTRHHEDPFDRLLIAQAQCEGMTLVSKDGKFSPYGIHVIW